MFVPSVLVFPSKCRDRCRVVEGEALVEVVLVEEVVKVLAVVIVVRQVRKQSCLLVVVVVVVCLVLVVGVELVVSVERQCNQTKIHPSV